MGRSFIITFVASDPAITTADGALHDFADQVAESAAQGCREVARSRFGTDTTNGDSYAEAARRSVLLKLQEMGIPPHSPVFNVGESVPRTPEEDR